MASPEAVVGRAKPPVGGKCSTAQPPVAESAGHPQSRAVTARVTPSFERLWLDQP
ncbi:hypothetical protein QFZ56_000150 [Streptomyces achromogenes]|uniref:Uncharacterized protein n=1 Tax=Streptomyces achromogenes TaxID=67255 RepID=A0ABU0PS19_STRAH|nr:hypothetical protein [Streptomyces achromogenes]